MKFIKKAAALLLAAVLALSAAACGGDSGPLRVVKTLGEKQLGLVFRSGDSLSDTVCAALEVVAGSGRLAELSIRWLGSDLTTLDGDINALNRLESFAEPRVLSIGVEGGSAPFAFENEGRTEGMSVELASAIAAALGWELRIEQISSAEVMTQLASGNIDCALGFDVSNIDPESGTVSEPYMESHVLLASLASSDYSSVRKMKDGRLALAAGDLSAHRFVAADTDFADGGITVTDYPSPDDCAKALAAGYAAGIVLDEYVLSSLQSEIALLLAQ